MSLGGSSVKLETGTQVDTKTRQKSLELSDKFSNFVSFEKDRITVTINKFLDLSNIVKVIYYTLLHLKLTLPSTLQPYYILLVNKL